MQVFSERRSWTVCVCVEASEWEQSSVTGSNTALFAFLRPVIYAIGSVIDEESAKSAHSSAMCKRDAPGRGESGRNARLYPRGICQLRLNPLFFAKPKKRRSSR